MGIFGMGLTDTVFKLWPRRSNCYLDNTFNFQQGTDYMESFQSGLSFIPVSRPKDKSY